MTAELLGNGAAAVAAVVGVVVDSIAASDSAEVILRPVTPLLSSSVPLQ